MPNQFPTARPTRSRRWVPLALLAACALVPAMPGTSVAAAQTAPAATTPKPIVVMAPGGAGSPADFNTTLASQPPGCGTNCPTGSDLTMAQAFRNIGYNVAVLDFTAHPYDIEKNAAKVRDVVNYLRAVAPGAKISLLSYSSGGWATRWYLRKMGGLDKIRTTVMLSAPHQGAQWPCFSTTNDWAQYCRTGPQMTELNGGDDTPGTIVYTSIYSTGDRAIGAALGEPANQNWLDGGACEGFLPDVTDHAHGSTHPQFILSAAAAVQSPGQSNCTMTNRPNIAA